MATLSVAVIEVRCSPRDDERRLDCRREDFPWKQRGGKLPAVSVDVPGNGAGVSGNSAGVPDDGSAGVLLKVVWWCGALIRATVLFLDGARHRPWCLGDWLMPLTGVRGQVVGLEYMYVTGDYYWWAVETMQHLVRVCVPFLFVSFLFGWTNLYLHDYDRSHYGLNNCERCVYIHIYIYIYIYSDWKAVQVTKNRDVVMMKRKKTTGWGEGGGTPQNTPAVCFSDRGEDSLRRRVENQRRVCWIEAWPGRDGAGLGAPQGSNAKSHHFDSRYSLRHSPQACWLSLLPPVLSNCILALMRFLCRWAVVVVRWFLFRFSFQYQWTISRAALRQCAVGLSSKLGCCGVAFGSSFWPVIGVGVREEFESLWHSQCRFRCVCAFLCCFFFFPQ